MRNRVSVKCKVKSAKLRSFLILLMGLVCLILPLSAFAATYYVDAVNGNDANPGTTEQPWKTLGRAYTWYSGAGTKVTEGDTVLFKDGDYGEFRENAGYGSPLQYRDDWITYKAAPGHSPTISNIYINQQDKWGDILHGSSYLSFVGFNISDGINVKYTSYVDFNDCNITRTPVSLEGFYAPYFASTAIGLNATTVYHGTIENCVFSNMYRGIRVSESGGDYWTIKNTTIHRTAEDGISPAGVSHLLIEGTLVYDTHKGRTHHGLAGTISGTFEVGEPIIQAGTNAEGIIRTVGSSVLSTYTTSETLFEKVSHGGGIVTGQWNGATMSAVTTPGYAHSDPIMITSSATVTDIVIRGNTFIPSGSGVAYFRFYGCATDVTIENNLFMDNAVGNANRFEVGGVTSGLKVRNNTFVTGFTLSAGQSNYGSKLPSVIDELYNNIMLSYGQSADVNESLYMRVVSHGNNIFGSNPNGAGGPTYPFALNSTEAVTGNLNALFTNAAGNDYTLAAGSAAIDFGNADYGPSSDILGNLRDAYPDAGCYEYGSSEAILGDITADGEVSINDVQACVSIILFVETDLGMIQRADISGPTVGEADGAVNIYDLQELVNMVLSS